jgi:hypothetical protein
MNITLKFSSCAENILNNYKFSIDKLDFAKKKLREKANSLLHDIKNVNFTKSKDECQEISL